MTAQTPDSQHNVIDQNDGDNDNNEIEFADEAQRKYGALNEYLLNNSDNNQRPLKKRKLLQGEFDEHGSRENRAKKYDFELVRHMLASARVKDNKIDLYV